MPCLRASLLSILGLAATIPAQATPQALIAPDGSRFLLLAHGGPPLIHWAVVSPAGDLVDPPAYPGLSFAVARASLNGTDTVGTRSWKDERKALTRIATLESEIETEVVRTREVPQQLVAELSRAQAQLAALRDEGAWLNEIRIAPAIDVRQREYPDAVLFSLTTTPEGIARVAWLLMDRRENTRLRSLKEVYAEVVAQREDDNRSMRARLHAEVLDLAFYGLGPRNPQAGIRPDPATAMQLYRSTQNPSATFHVITGGFDMEEMRKFLRRQFNVTNLDSTPAPRPRPRDFSRERTSTITGGSRAAVALGIKVPPGLDSNDVEIFAEWLAGGDQSALAIALRASNQLDLIVSVRTPFPTSAQPGLILVEVWEGTNPDISRKPNSILAGVRTALEKVIKRGPGYKQARPAYDRLMHRQEILRSDPRRLAEWLATECGLRGRPPGMMLGAARPKLDVGRLKTLVQPLLADGHRVLVQLEPKR